MQISAWMSLHLHYNGEFGIIMHKLEASEIITNSHMATFKFLPTLIFRNKLWQNLPEWTVVYTIFGILHKESDDPAVVAWR